MNNAAEYVLGSNPNQAGANPVLLSVVTIDSDEFLRITMPRNPAATDATLSVETSAGLSPASWTSDGLLIETNTPSRFQLRATEPIANASQRFFRIQVHLEP